MTRTLIVEISGPCDYCIRDIEKGIKRAAEKELQVSHFSETTVMVKPAVHVFTNNHLKIRQYQIEGGE